MCDLTPTVLQTWLEWAGAKLIAMPGRREGPSGPKVIWPEYNRNTFEILKFRGTLSPRAAAPNKDEIDVVDKILLFPNVCSDPLTRRILHVRALVHPINGRHLYPWRRIGKLLRTDHKTVKRRHQHGLLEAVDKIPYVKVCEVKYFMESYAA